VATSGPIVDPHMIYEHGAPGRMILTKETKELREKPVPVHI
jgi:hypothetical protein